jgi:RNA polymerase sigma-70 factor (ECF subfamily)
MTDCLPAALAHDRVHVPVETGPPDIAAAFTAHAPRLLAYLSRQVGPAEAEDLLAETFCIAWQRRQRYRADSGPLVAWLFGIAVNLVRHQRRSWLRGTRAAGRLWLDRDGPDGDDADRVADRVDAAAHMSVLRAELAALPARDRDVLLLASWAQLDHAEIAAALDIPLGTVRCRLHRARGRLRAVLADPSADIPNPTPWSTS